MLIEHQVRHWPVARRDLRLECGPHQIAAALRAHGQEVGIDELYAGPLLRYLDWTLPYDPAIVLRRYGVRSSTRFWSRGGFFARLVGTLERGNPALIIIRSIQGTGCLHWISAWGYDEAADAFLCYDSQCETSTNPEGNVRYSSAQLLNSLPWRGSFAVEVHS